MSYTVETTEDFDREFKRLGEKALDGLGFYYFEVGTVEPINSD